MFKEEYFYQIDAYLTGEMTESERANFEQAVRENPNLADELAKMRQILRGVKKFDAELLKAKIKGVQDDLETEGFFNETATSSKELVNKVHLALESEGFFSEKKETPVRRLAVWQWAVAASLAILVVAGLWFFNQKQTMDTPSVASHYFDLDSAATIDFKSQLRTRTAFGQTSDTAAKNHLLKGLDFYTTKNYASAQTIFEDHLSQYAQHESSAAQFYLGICLLKQNKDLPKAIDLFKNLSNSDWSNEANWFLALTYLKNGQNTEGVNLLKKTTQTGATDYQTAASALLEELKK